MPLTVKQWVMTQPVYINAVTERDALLAEVADLRGALKGAAHAHRVESNLLASDLEALRAAHETLELDLEALRVENAALRERLSRSDASLKVKAVG